MRWVGWEDRFDWRGELGSSPVGEGEEVWLCLAAGTGKRVMQARYGGWYTKQQREDGEFALRAEVPGEDSG